MNKEVEAVLLKEPEKHISPSKIPRIFSFSEYMSDEIYLKCPRCKERLFPLLLHNDKNNNQQIFWACMTSKSGISCTLFTTLPKRVVCVARSQRQARHNLVLCPRFHRIDSSNRHFFPNIFKNGEFIDSESVPKFVRMTKESNARLLDDFCENAPIRREIILDFTVKLKQVLEGKDGCGPAEKVSKESRSNIGEKLKPNAHIFPSASNFDGHSSNSSSLIFYRHIQINNPQVKVDVFDNDDDDDLSNLRRSELARESAQHFVNNSSFGSVQVKVEPPDLPGYSVQSIMHQRANVNELGDYSTQQSYVTNTHSFGYGTMPQIKIEAPDVDATAHSFQPSNQHNHYNFYSNSGQSVNLTNGLTESGMLPQIKVEPPSIDARIYSHQYQPAMCQEMPQIKIEPVDAYTQAYLPQSVYHEAYWPSAYEGQINQAHEQLAVSATNDAMTHSTISPDNFANNEEALARASGYYWTDITDMYPL